MSSRPSFKRLDLWKRSIFIGGGTALSLGLFYTFTAGYIYLGGFIGALVGLTYTPFYLVGLPTYFFLSLVFKNCSLVPTPKWCGVISAIIINFIFIIVGTFWYYLKAKK